MPLLATFGDDLLVYRDLGADDLGLCIIQTWRSVKDGVALEGLSVDVKGELTLLLVQIDWGFDSADLIKEYDRENWWGVTKGNARLVEVSLVKGDVDSLVLGKVLGNQHVLHPSYKEYEGMESDQTSTCYRFW